MAVHTATMAVHTAATAVHTAAMAADTETDIAVGGLRRQVGRVITALVVASRVATLGMVALSVVALAGSGGYAAVPPAVAVYTMVGGWGFLLMGLVLRRDPRPNWVLVTDVGVTCVGVAALPWAVREDAYAIMSNPDFQPITVSVAVAVALISASARWTLAACGAMGIAYLAGQLTWLHGVSDLVSEVSTVCWQLGAGLCCYVFIHRLHAVVTDVDTATERIARAREQVATQRAQTEERIRGFRQQMRRYRALHDGPLRILTAIAGAGPLGHPGPDVRRQCAISVNVLRGLTPDSPDATVTDLSLALIEAGGDSAVYGLRVEYHFADLPDDLPAPVVQALRQASAEALGNVVAHAGTSRVRVTAMGTGDTQHPRVTVAIVDQGAGFDPATTQPGYGLRQSIIERMAEAGGAATIDSYPGQGTRVDLKWPR